MTFSVVATAGRSASTTWRGNSPCADGTVYVGIMPYGGGTDLSGFARGAGYTVDTTAAQAMVWLADVIQDELAGYEFVQWPIDGQRILVPKMRDDAAVWVRPATDELVCRIGDLCGDTEKA